MDTPRPRHDGATGIPEVDRLQRRWPARLLILAGLLSLLVLILVGGWIAQRGLARPLVTVAGPGPLAVDLPAGRYVWTKPASRDAPAGSPPLRLVSLDPGRATITPSEPGRWIEMNSVRLDVLAELAVETGGAVQLELAGGPGRFPVALYRDQMWWLERVGIGFAALLVIPVGLTAAGVAIAVRSTQRRNAALIDAMGAVS